ncbi:hypothetical protein GCM10010149_19010 [Nonomuraea roseoviolacea subsp. roseoviolacea]
MAGRPCEMSPSSAWPGVACPTWSSRLAASSATAALMRLDNTPFSFQVIATPVIASQVIGFW